MPRRPLVTVKELAVYLGSSERQVRNMVDRRSVPHKKLGPEAKAPLRFDLDEIDRWLEANQREVAS